MLPDQRRDRPLLLRGRPRARGRYGRIKKRSSHLTVVVSRFDDDELDYRGFPNMTIRYALTEREEAEIAAAVETITRAATALGDFVPGSEPRVLPNGSSFHYMGTMRIGEADDGTSVCAVDSRVWGFENLYLGGNGLIPTANFVNPTLTSVALAVLGVESIVAGLR